MGPSRVRHNLATEGQQSPQIWKWAGKPAQKTDNRNVLFTQSHPASLKQPGHPPGDPPGQSPAQWRFCHAATREVASVLGSCLNRALASGGHHRSRETRTGNHHPGEHNSGVSQDDCRQVILIQRPMSACMVKANHQDLGMNSM